MTMGEDPFSRYDAAYVLGALTARDRRAFEAHLSDCPACVAAVADLAGVPGLLGRAHAEGVTRPVPDAGAVPHTLLPQLIAASRSEQSVRRLWLALAGGLAAAVVVLVAFVAGAIPDTRSPAGRSVSLTAVRATPVDVTVTLQRVAWGTKVHLRSTYSATLPTQGPDEKVVFRLVAVARNNGREQTVAQWRGLPGQDAIVDGSTDLAPPQIERLRLETPDGTVLLETEPR